VVIPAGATVVLLCAPIRDCECPFFRKVTTSRHWARELMENRDHPVRVGEWLNQPEEEVRFVLPVPRPASVRRAGTGPGPPVNHQRARSSRGARTSPLFERCGSDRRWPGQSGRTLPAAIATGRVCTRDLYRSCRKRIGVLPKRPVTPSDRL
jgi:hypothetical protein